MDTVVSLKVPAYVAERVRRAMPEGCFVVPASTPVVSFGDPYRARVAMLGLNPSSSEFLRPDGQLLAGESQRLESLASLGVESLVDASDEVVARVVRACYGYFAGPNPYWEFFGHMERLLAAGGWSYRDGSACHLDLVQWATDPIWGGIPDDGVQKQLLLADAAFLRRQLAETDLRLVLVNGATAVAQVEAVGGQWHKKKELPPGRGKAWLLKGWLEDVPLLGWTPYIPSGFVSAARRAAIIDAIAAAAADLDEREDHAPTTATHPELGHAPPPAMPGRDEREQPQGPPESPGDRPAVAFLLTTTEAGAAGLLVLTADSFALATGAPLPAEQSGDGPETRMREAWPPDGEPEGLPELAMLRRAVAVLAAGYERHRVTTAPDIEQALHQGLELLGQLTGPQDLHVYQWPSGERRRRQAHIGDRRQLLDLLAAYDDPTIWIAATSSRWVVDGPSYITRLADGWTSDVLHLARDHPAGHVRDLALQVTGAMSASALARATSQLGHGEAMYLAGQPWTSPERLHELVEQWPQTRRRILRRPDTDAELLLRFAQDPDDVVAALALDDPRLTPGDLVKLLQSMAGRRALTVARHERLALDDPRLADPTLPNDVRLALATRPDAPDSLLEWFVDDEKPAVRLAVAGRCASTAVRRLLRDPHAATRRAAAANPRLSADDAVETALRTGDTALLLGAAGRDDVDEARARALVGAVLDHPAARAEDIAAAAGHPAAEPGALVKLLAHPAQDVGVSAAALENPRCPSDVVSAHLTDPDPTVRSAALTAVQVRRLPVTREQLEQACSAPLRPRPRRDGMIGLEVPMEMPRMLVRQLLQEQGLA